MPTALVTGSLGGIGRSICTVLRARGWRVIGTDRVAGECVSDLYIAGDLRDFQRAPERVVPFVEKVRAFAGGKLDLLVNNAAYQVVKPAEDLTPQDWDDTISTNLTAPFQLIRTFLPELEAAQGSVVNVASIHANLTKPGFVAYATSKGAMVTMTRALAVELGPRGIRVNAILPAATETPMLRAGFEGNPEGYAELAALHPIGRIARPEEIAESVVYLASPGAGFITGAALEIDGGIGGRLHDPV